MKTALFSVPFSDNILCSAQALIDMGWSIIITPNLKEEFDRKQLPYVNISDFVDFKEELPFPPTLHPKVEQALTSDGDNVINLIYDITYPLSEGNDVGGHALLALGAKGNRIVCSDNEDVEAVIADLKQNKDNAEISEELKKNLQIKALKKNIRPLYGLSG